MAFPFAAAVPAAVAAATYFSGRAANRANERIADKQMDFQERMSNTSYARAMQDLQNAGLNPILASRFGGASTPSGASYTSQGVLAPAVASAVEAKRTLAELRNLDATNDKIRSETFLNNALRKASEVGIGNTALQQKMLQAKLPLEVFKSKTADSANSAFDYLNKSRQSLGTFIGTKVYDFFHRKH